LDYNKTAARALRTNLGVKASATNSSGCFLGLQGSLGLAADQLALVLGQHGKDADGIIFY
jgi:hypothetical protein